MKLRSFHYQILSALLVTSHLAVTSSAQAYRGPNFDAWYRKQEELQDKSGIAAVADALGLDAKNKRELLRLAGNHKLPRMTIARDPYYTFEPVAGRTMSMALSEPRNEAASFILTVNGTKAVWHPVGVVKTDAAALQAFFMSVPPAPTHGFFRWSLVPEAHADMTIDIIVGVLAVAALVAGYFVVKSLTNNVKKVANQAKTSIQQVGNSVSGTVTAVGGQVTNIGGAVAGGITTISNAAGGAITSASGNIVNTTSSAISSAGAALSSLGSSGGTSGIISSGH